ncbi:hypothetical protein Hdeb2414_s0025g00667281 [Helianthus debilis subsp. tardiflorus]
MYQASNFVHCNSWITQGCLEVERVHQEEGSTRDITYCFCILSGLKVWPSFCNGICEPTTGTGMDKKIFVKLMDQARKHGVDEFRMEDSMVKFAVFKFEVASFSFRSKEMIVTSILSKLYDNQISSVAQRELEGMVPFVNCLNGNVEYVVFTVFAWFD